MSPASPFGNRAARVPVPGGAERGTAVLKKLFGGGGKASDQVLTIDDLIVLERYDEAATALQTRIKSNPRDLHSRLKLAEVYFAQRQGAKAVDEYLYVAEEYAADGFHDKAIALLTKAMRLAPSDTTLPAKIEKLKQTKKLEHSRVQAIEGMVLRAKASGASIAGGTSAFEMQRLWGNIEESTLVRRLDADQLKRLFSAMDFQRLGEDVIFVERGQRSEELYFIVDGEIQAAIPKMDGWTTVRTYGPGKIVGEGALLERKPWPAFYHTEETTTVLKLTRSGLEAAMLGNPDPRALIEALREQRNDAEVAALVAKIEA